IWGYGACFAVAAAFAGMSTLGVAARVHALGYWHGWRAEPSARSPDLDLRREEI
ncbi:MAG TPA: MFS transporter, partial [Rhodospirillum rubrum]|nr:MFS transporter [Rhodospirillum rubrum]